MAAQSEKCEGVFDYLVRLLERAVREGSDSVGLEWEDDDLVLVHYFGYRGELLGTIHRELQEALVKELIDRSGLDRLPRGQMQLNLAGKDYNVIVDQRDDSDQPALNLLLKKSLVGH